ncbi:disease resistance protein RUN1-like [Telopea speciosissima]|uniref:disease resistance protein RUN1-like n=1 Tax=Telopea speciosissima TaxID=54955 RepID=UPI001CC46E6D|nr:disease resistance protein RUN1-like [Telopea speciosissima]
MAAAHDQASSSSSSSSGLRSYEVFLSFHGEDVRTNFADHLYCALDRAGIRTYRDEDKLPKGETIGPELISAIQDSIISIPILSPNYGSSKWCRNALTQISECRKTKKQIVFPIFYKVEPTEVRNQKNKYEEAFVEYQRRVDEYQKDLVEKYQFQFGSSTAQLPDRTMLHRHDMESGDRKIVVIHGLGGIGKTTIAKVVCDTVLSHFEGYKFIENVRENAERFGIPYLQNQLINDLLKEKNQNITDVGDGIKVIQQRYCNKKVLIVLDDVDQVDQVESLAGNREWFGNGSKIIITTRNKEVFIAQKPDSIYEPKVMEFNDCLKLFSQYAFGTDQPLEGYLDLSKAMVESAGRLPLALRVIGSSLLDEKRKVVWKDRLKKMQKFPDDRVMKSLKISYDGLGCVEQQMFLDTACFFIGMNKDIAFYIWEGCDFFPQAGLEVLCKKSLVTINEDDSLRMHDMLRDLGRFIVCQENIQKPGQRSRIWSQKEVFEVLVKQTGTSICEGLSIDFKQFIHSINGRPASQCLTSKGFAAMKDLRLLQVDYAQSPENFTNSFSELRWLSWKGCSTNLH